MKKFLYVTADVKYGVSQYGGYVMKIFARIFLLYVLTIVVLSSCSTLDLAVMANNRGDYKSAAKYYTRYIKEREKENMEFNSFIYEERARMYLRTGEPEKARADYEAIIRNDTYPLWAMYVSAVEWIFHTYVPTSAFKVWARGNSTYNHARYADRNENEIIIRKTYELAIKYFSEAIDIAPDYASAYRDRANCYFGMGNYDQAGEDFEKAIARYSDKGINPEDLIGKNLDIVYMYTKLVAIYEKRKDFDKAIEYYNILSKNNPDKDWSVYGESGVIVEKVKELAATGWTKQPAAASAEPVRQSSVPSVSLADDLLNIASGKADAKYWTGRAERGEARAQFELGVHYHNGTGGVRKDMARAVSWYTRAAESGYDPAQYNLALCYLDGAGVIKNEKKAFEWFVNAAEHGHAEAQYNAGVCYYFGEGTTKDLSKAAWWFSKSAEQKNVDAQFNLAMLYLNGEGVTQDRAKALLWFNQAARQGHTNAKDARDTLIRMGYTMPRNSEQDMLARDYTKAGEGAYRAVLYKPFDDLKTGAIAADDSCVFISKVYVDSNFRADINTWFKVMDQKYTGNGAGVISDEPGKQKFFTMIFNDRTFIPKIGDTVYIGWRIDNTANVQLSSDVERTSLALLSRSNGFDGILFESVPVAFAASYSESEVLEKVRMRIKR